MLDLASSACRRENTLQQALQNKCDETHPGYFRILFDLPS